MATEITIIQHDINDDIKDKIEYIQFDNNSRILHFEVTDRTSTGSRDSGDYINLNGCTVWLIVRKGSGEPVIIDGEILDADNGQFRFVLTEQALAETGEVKCQYVITSPDTRLSSREFIINVKPSLADDLKITSSAELTALTEALQGVTAASAVLSVLQDGYAEYVKQGGTLDIANWVANFMGTAPDTGGGSGGNTGNTTHGIVWDLVNVTSSNSVVSVSDGASLVAVLTAANGYRLGDVTVTMAGEVVTDCWNADTTTVTIASVTGDLIISCTGIEKGVEEIADTSPIIAQYDVGFGSFDTQGEPVPIEDFINVRDGMCITQIYSYEPNIAAIKAGEHYDSENDYLTFANIANCIIAYTPSLKAREAGYSPSPAEASKIVNFRDGEGVEYHSNTSLTTSSNPTTFTTGSGGYKTNSMYANGIAFTLATLDIDDSYAYWADCTYMPVGVRAGDIIFAGKNTPYYGMANIDGTFFGQPVTVELSYDDDIAQNYSIATASVLGDEPIADTNTAYGISSEFAEVINTVKGEWMTEYGGDYRKIPIIVSTDQHGRVNSGIFNLIGKTVSMHDVSKIMNLGDTINEWYDDDIDKPLLSNSGLENWCESVKAIPFSKQLNVFGNHDTWYGNHVDDGNAIGTRYPSSQAHLNQYFRNIYARRTNNNGWFVTYDDQFNVKYVVVSAFEYQNSVKFRIGTAQMKWLISELEKNDGYDVVIISHVPLYETPSQLTYPTGQTSTTTARVSELNTDDLFSARKTKGSGTITDSDGVEHAYDFTSCENNLLCSLHGHTHYDAYLYLNDTLLVNAFDWFDDSTFFMVLIDRVNRFLNVWKIEAPNGVPTYQNYQISLDKPAE